MNGKLLCPDFTTEPISSMDTVRLLLILQYIPEVLELQEPVSPHPFLKIDMNSEKKNDLT